MAGSNATTRGVPRRVIQGESARVPVIGANEIPTIQYSSGNARALAQFSRDLFSISNQFEDQLDQQAEAESASAGTIAGATAAAKGTTPELQTYGTIRGRAFSKAAIESFASTLDTNAVAKLSQLQQQFWNDPAGLEKAWGDYSSGVASELDKTSPEQGIAFRNRALIRSLPAIEAAKDTAYKLTRSEADAKLIENESALRAEIKANSADLFSENPDRSRAAANAVSMVQNDLMRIYNAKDPTTGKPLYTPEEIAKAKKNFTDVTMSEGVLSWFDEQPDKAGAYLKFASGDFKIKLDMNNNQVPIINKAGGIRTKPLGKDWYEKASAAAAATGDNVGIVIVSAAQAAKGTPGAARTGSTRHDVDENGEGHTADIRLTVGGREVLPGDNPDLYAKFMHNSAAAGFTGIGHYAWGIHIGNGSKAAWGPDTKGDTLNQTFGEAIRSGWEGPPLETKPRQQEVSIKDTVSETAFNGLDAEMRQRIGFANSMQDRKTRLEKDALEAQQANNSYAYTARVYAAGSADPSTGKPIPAVTANEVNAAVARGVLKASDGESIIKALTTERPQRSDETTLRDLQNRLYGGEDIYRAIIDAGGKLSADDSAQLLAKNNSVNKNDNDELKGEKKFYYGQLSDRLSGGAGLLAGLDQGRADRKSAGLTEYYQRVQDPENTDSPEVIANDIAQRATRAEAGLADQRLQRMVPPRYSVTVPGQYRVDVEQSKKALQAAYNAKKLTQDQLVKEVNRLREWQELQKIVDAQSAAGKTK